MGYWKQHRDYLVIGYCVFILLITSYLLWFQRDMTLANIAIQLFILAGVIWCGSLFYGWDR